MEQIKDFYKNIIYFVKTLLRTKLQNHKHYTMLHVAKTDVPVALLYDLFEDNKYFVVAAM